MASAELSSSLFTAKRDANLTFADLSAALGRDEVAVAAIFYGQAQASEEDVRALSAALGIPEYTLRNELTRCPERGSAAPMPPREPLIYRLYEIVQNYGMAYKAVLNEKLGDGIMSAIGFKTKVEKVVEEDGSTWAVIELRGKWLPYSRF